MITRRDFFRITAATGALITVGNIVEAKDVIQPVLPENDYALEKAREIPIISTVDVVVVGGSSRAIAAAAAIAKSGRSVFLLAEMSYLGDDICGSFLFNKESDKSRFSVLAKTIFEEKDNPKPLHVKTVLETTLIENNIDFLYSSYVTNALVDSNNKLAGLVIANRSGRQAIRCNAIVDATHSATVAHLFQAEFSNLELGEQEFTFTVVGNKVKASSDYEANVLPFKFTANKKDHDITQCYFKLAMADNSYASLMAIEQKIRSAVWDCDQVDSSDLLWYIPQQSIVAKKEGKAEHFALGEKLDKELFQPKHIEQLWILGPCASLPRNFADELFSNPVLSINLGLQLGEEIASGLPATSPSEMVKTVSRPINGTDYGEIKEILNPLRPNRMKGMALSGTDALPILGRYDVVVLGGGTAGAPAGISAARQGAKTLVLEYLHGLGGLSTLGLIGRYWDGFRGGFTSKIDSGVRNMAPLDHPRQLKEWQEESLSDWKQEWYRQELLKAGGNAWYGILGCGALVEKGNVKGVVISTPFGRGVVLSKILIDSTGSADIAIAAGAAFEYTGKNSLAVQGAGLGKMSLGDFYNNNDWAFIDDSDILDVSRIFVQAKVKLKGQYDLVKIPQTRERRRVVGDYTISVYDVLNHRKYPDTISYHKSSFDTHGMITDPYFLLSPPLARHAIYEANVPLRSLLPKGLDGILTTGLGASAHRDAMPVIRMQSCLQNQGYAVGYLSAMCVKEDNTLRKMDIKKIQRHLVEIGNLPESVLTDKEFGGYSKKEMQQAVLNVADNYKDLEILLTDKKQCISLIKKQINRIEEEDQKVIYASILCILGNGEYAKILEEKIGKTQEWDKGWNYTGMGQFGMSSSSLDGLIIALGNAKQTSSLPVILDKAKMLKSDSYFSHIRAIAKATEAIHSEKAVPVLADLLSQPDVQGHDIANYKEAREKTVPGWEDTSVRNAALKELHIARALFTCGDKNTMAQAVLRKYGNGLQGHYARYANEILNS